jgi:hypothetical protein
MDRPPARVGELVEDAEGGCGGSPAAFETAAARPPQAEEFP